MEKVAKTSAERKRASREKQLKNMTETQLVEYYRKKEYKRRVALRRKQLSLMNAEEKTAYRAKDLKRKRKAPDKVVLPFDKAYRSRQSLGKAIKRAGIEPNGLP